MLRYSFIALAVALLFCSMQVHAQVDSVTVEKVSIINAKHKVEGIYQTFDEFRRNEPFYTDSFTILPAEISTAEDENSGVFGGFGNSALDYIDCVESELETKPLRHPPFGSRYFGYCKNDTVYIGFWRFHPITEWGHLTLIHVSELRYHQNSGSWMAGGAGGAPTFSPGFGGMVRSVNKWFVLDYMTGDIASISTLLLKDKFNKWDKELYQEYRKTKNKNSESVQLEFLRKFNERHPIKF
ncbi:MAG: hypothetical protein GC178_11120 [Flavobacteriales bacterium]|nr:hypothetical protein [Flavobacteriales bacterium]